MLIIPAIDLKNGKCVRLTQGDFDKETIYSSNPITMAKKWEKEGAQMLHLVDLDGAKDGVSSNLEVIQKIVKSIKIPVQVGGGIRTLETIEKLLDVGVMRVILGTLALENEPLLKTILTKYSAQVAVALDARNGILVKKGWQETANKNLTVIIKFLESLGVQRFIFTDITKDGTLKGPNFAEIEKVMQNSTVPVIIGGGITTINDVNKIKQIKAEGVVIGKALYEGRLTLKEALNVS